ncbi:MAG TPA: pyridoxamine 5'-phosphate oxidase family protein [Actinomycetota bacterium]|jgi:hypothetical protein
MDPEELEPLRRGFRDAPTCRIATVGPDGLPHVASRWFVWIDAGLFVATPRGDATWRNLEARPDLSVVIDRGRAWAELAGVRIDGTGELSAVEHPDMRVPMSAWHEKYRASVAGDGFEQLTRDVPAIGFVRILPVSAHAWDHARAPGIVRGSGPA